MNVIRTICLVVLAILALAPPVRAQEDGARPDPVVVLAFDGASAREVERLMDADKMPRLAALRAEGSYRRLATTNPAQSPVSWAAMTTGVNPGRTGIYDFLRRVFPQRGGVSIAIGVGEAVRVPFLTGLQRGLFVFGAGLLGVLLGGLVVLLLLRRAKAAGRPWKKKRAEALLTVPAAILAVAALAVLQYVPDEVVEARNLRGGEPFWVTLDQAGLNACAIEAPMAFPADDMHIGCCLSGLGTPDVKGTWGTFAIWTDDASIPGSTETGGVAYFVPPGETTFDVVLAGPPDPLLPADERVEIGRKADEELYRRELALDWNKGRRRVSETEETLLRLGTRLTVTLRATKWAKEGLVLTLQDGTQASLVVNEWSELLPITFRLSPLAAVTSRAELPARVRFLWTYDTNERTFSLLATPVQFDPSRRLPPNVKIASPPEFAQELAAAAGPFESIGWPELTNPVKDDVLSDHAFLQHLRVLMANREKRLMSRLATGKHDCVFSMFGETDRVQHALWRHMDPESPRYDPDVSPAMAREIDRIYEEMDRVVGRVLDEYPSARVLVVSDHGFAPFRRGVNLNNFLRAQGFQVGYAGSSGGPKAVGDLFGGTFFTDVDWSQTRAYAMGLGNVYLNLAGRETDGIVEPEEIDALLSRIREKLLVLRDTDGTKVVREVYFGKDLYEGDRAHEAPDLVVGFEWGYRVSWQTCLGALDDDVITDNMQRWSGDHCSVDPSLVPGVLFANFPLADGGEPDVLDVVPTILELLDVTREGLEGESVLPR